MTTEYDTRHGGPFDRGSADAYYGRSFNPHYYVGDTYSTTRVDLKDMNAKEIVAYSVGYGKADHGFVDVGGMTYDEVRFSARGE